MNFTTETILDTTTYGIASGNYDGSSNDFNSNAVIAVNYYAGQGSIQTVTIQVTGFDGKIVLQASLNDTVESAKWFDVYEYGHDSSPRTDYHPVSLTGNFVWMRANITNFDAGTINSISISY
jgi:hypothetical protein